jgi:hypothetical protein
VPHKIRHQDVDYIGINAKALHSSKYYTD